MRSPRSGGAPPRIRSRDWTALLDWYRAAARDLPWRRNPDPYSVWVSEIMLQQTRVATVVPHYERFLERFPDVSSLAAAPEAEVLRLWEGLGYYRRARALHRGAAIVRERHGGVFPRERNEALALPGVGAYTAAAVRSIAYGIPEPCIDGNIRRVAGRLLALEAVIGSAEFDRTVETVLRREIRRRDPGVFNQALMELGARICLSRAPRCAECPLRPSCAAARLGDPEKWPRRPPPAASVARSEVCLVWRCDGGFLLSRRRPSRRWGGLWECPRRRIRADADPEEAAARLARRRFGAVPSALRFLGTERYQVTQYRVTMHVVGGRGGSPAALPANAACFAAEELRRIAVPAPQRRILDRYFPSRAGRETRRKSG